MCVGCRSQSENAGEGGGFSEGLLDFIISRRKLPSFLVPPPRLQGAEVQHFIPERKKTVVQRLSQISQAATLGGRGTEDSIFSGDETLLILQRFMYELVRGSVAEGSGSASMLLSFLSPVGSTQATF